MPARGERTRRRSNVWRYIGLVLAATIVLFPVYSAFVVSVQPASKLFEFPGILLPTDPDFGTFGRAFDRANLDQFLLTSAIVSIVITVGQVISSILAAYAFAFLRFPMKGLVFALFLATLMIPSEV